MSGGLIWDSSPNNIFGYASQIRTYFPSQILDCAALDTYTLKVGLITADELVFAGGGYANNASYFLYNGQSYWSMSPFRWYYKASTNHKSAGVFYVLANGYLGDGDVSVAYGIRPVINLKDDLTFATSQNGTKDNPYIV